MENRPNRGREDEEIDLTELIMLLVEKIPLMIAVGLFTALLAFLYCKFMTAPSYQSTTKIYVLTKEDKSSVTIADLQMGTQLTKDYEELIQSRFVLEEVIEQLHLGIPYESLKGRVSVATKDDTRIIAITVTDSNPVRAMQIANAIRESSAVHILNVMDIEAINVVETADVPTVKAAPNVGKTVMMGGLLGAMIVVAISVLTYLLNDTIKTAEDVEKYLGLSTLALIPLNEGEQKKKRRSRRGRK